MAKPIEIYKPFKCTSDGIPGLGYSAYFLSPPMPISPVSIRSYVVCLRPKTLHRVRTHIAMFMSSLCVWNGNMLACQRNVQQRQNANGVVLSFSQLCRRRAHLRLSHAAAIAACRNKVSHMNVVTSERVPMELQSSMSAKCCNWIVS